MAKRPDFSINTNAVNQRILGKVAHKGIVLGHRAIVIQPQHLTQVRLHVLCWREFLAISRGNPKKALIIKEQTVSVMAIAQHFWVLTPDHLKIHQRRTLGIKVNPSTANCGPSSSVGY